MGLGLSRYLKKVKGRVAGTGEALLGSLEGTKPLRLLSTPARPRFFWVSCTNCDRSSEDPITYCCSWQGVVPQRRDGSVFCGAKPFQQALARVYDKVGDPPVSVHDVDEIAERFI